MLENHEWTQQSRPFFSWTLQSRQGRQGLNKEQLKWATQIPNKTTEEGHRAAKTRPGFWEATGACLGSNVREALLKEATHSLTVQWQKGAQETSHLYSDFLQKDEHTKRRCAIPSVAPHTMFQQLQKFQERKRIHDNLHWEAKFKKPPFPKVAKLKGISLNSPLEQNLLQSKEGEMEC